MNAKATVLGATMMALVVTGCSKKVGGQVVAVVNGQEITQQELNGELNGAQIPASADKKAIMAQLLQRVIDRKLLTAKAEADKLDQSPAFLAQMSRAHDAILIDLLAAKVAKGQPVPSAASVNQFITSNASLFGERRRYQLDQIAFPASNDPALAAKLQAAKSMDAVIAALKEAGVPYQAGKGALDTAAIPPDAGRRIAALAPGEPFLVPQNGQIVASVIRSSEPVPVPADQATAGATQLVRRQAVEAAMQAELKRQRDAAKITYGAGFAPPKTPAGAAAPGG